MDKATAKFGSIYFTILGILAMAFGILEFVVLGQYGAEGVAWGPLAIGDPDTGGVMLVWSAIILIGAGALYLSSIAKFGETRQLAKSVAASIMIWIVAAMAIWAMVAGSIPGGEEGGWFIPPGEELAELWFTIPPALFLLPFSLAIIYFILRRRRIAT